MRVWMGVAVSLLAMGVSTSEAADGVPDELRACAAKETRLERGECLEEWARRLGATIGPEQVPTPAPALGGESRDLPAPSRIVRRWNYEAEREPYHFTAYRPNYLLPVAYNMSPNDDPLQQVQPGAALNHTEIKFQLSFKTKVADDLYEGGPGELFDGNLDLWLGYTQLAFWQAYASDYSSPFRETDYEPEVFLSYETCPSISVTGKDDDGSPAQGCRDGWPRFVDLGFVHQSNGRAEPQSRSWNRLYARAGWTWGDFAAVPTVWVRFPEEAASDDNPDIDDYLGIGDFWFYYSPDEEHTFELLLRNNLELEGNRGGVQLGWTFPLTFGSFDLRPLLGYVQYYNGFGESLIDYDSAVSRVSVGVKLVDWFDVHSRP